MKRALAAALLCALAACSSGGDDDGVAQPVADRDRATTSTTGFDVDPEEGFLRAMESRMGWTGSGAQAAQDTAKGLCGLLSDEESDGVDRAVIDLTVEEYAGPTELISDVLLIGSEYFCPEHRDQIHQYFIDNPPQDAPSPTTTAAPETTSPTTLAEPTVTYEVLGTGEALVTYGTAGFSQEQHTVRLPWSHTITGDVPEHPIVLAQLMSGSGEITCKVWGGGDIPMVEATSSGNYAIVTCSDD